MSNEREGLTVDRLRRYLADAYKRGADHQRDGEVPEGYEQRIRESEAWANHFVGLRLENGLLTQAQEPEPVVRVDPTMLAFLKSSQNRVGADGVPLYTSPVASAPEPDVEDVLHDAGYEIADVGRPEVTTGCNECGRDVEAINGVCIRCAAKTAPTYWEGDE